MIIKGNQATQNKAPRKTQGVVVVTSNLDFIALHRGYASFVASMIIEGNGGIQNKTPAKSRGCCRYVKPRFYCIASRLRLLT